MSEQERDMAAELKAIRAIVKALEGLPEESKRRVLDFIADPPTLKVAMEEPDDG